MPRVAQSVRFTALPGRGEELAAVLVPPPGAAAPGCELYVVARETLDPDAVQVWEVWSDREAMASALEEPEVRTRIGAVMALLAHAPEAVPVAPVGGVGLQPEAS
jgi:quinol monooxygenase YgiN